MKEKITCERGGRYRKEVEVSKRLSPFQTPIEPIFTEKEEKLNALST